MNPTLAWLSQDPQARALAAGPDAPETLRQYVYEYCPDLPPCLYSDLLYTALTQVDWAQVATALGGGQ